MLIKMVETNGKIAVRVFEAHLQDECDNCHIEISNRKNHKHVEILDINLVFCNTCFDKIALS